MKHFFLILCALCAWTAQASTVYTRINNKPSAGWPGTYIVVYEKSASEAYVWDATDGSNNFVSVAISNGKITSENLAGYHVSVSEEGSNRYYLRTSDGYIGCPAKQNGLTFTSGGKECTLKVNGGYTMLETNTNTCRFLCYESGSNFRFRFYYDKDKKWTDNKKHNIYSVREIIYRWAPPQDHNNTRAYIERVCKEACLRETDQIVVDSWIEENRDDAMWLVWAMAKVENGDKLITYEDIETVERGYYKAFPQYK